MKKQSQLKRMAINTEDVFNRLDTGKLDPVRANAMISAVREISRIAMIELKEKIRRGDSTPLTFLTEE